MNLYIFIIYTKLFIIKRNEEHLSLHRIPPLYAPFTYAHKTISRSSKSKPPENSRMFHLSLAIYAMTIIVFEAKARYAHWTSESTHYGHHLCLVVIIQSRAHRTTLYLLMTWLVDQLNAPRGTSSVASHYLTTIVPTCRLVSTLHLHSYKIHNTLIKNRVGDDGVPAILQYRPSDLYLTDRKETMAILQKGTHTPLHICK